MFTFNAKCIQICNYTHKTRPTFWAPSCYFTIKMKTGKCSAAKCTVTVQWGLTIRFYFHECSFDWFSWWTHSVTRVFIPNLPDSMCILEHFNYQNLCTGSLKCVFRLWFWESMTVVLKIWSEALLKPRKIAFKSKQRRMRSPFFNSFLTVQLRHYLILTNSKLFKTRPFVQMDYTVDMHRLFFTTLCSSSVLRMPNRWSKIALSAAML